MIVLVDQRKGLGADLFNTSITKMSLEQIHAAIPHRAPMLLLDEICSQNSESIVCQKTFREDEFFVQGHFPGQPIVPGVIQCEACLQAGAVLLGNKLRQTDSLPVATRMDGVKFKQIVRPGETVEIQVTLNEQLSNAYYMTGKMLLNGKIAMRLEFACSVVPAQTESRA